MPILLADFARTVGATLGRISRQVGSSAGRSRPRARSMPSSLGATEDQVNMQATLPERVDHRGTKVEDLAGTGVADALGG
jgi:hypothetical protein